jgi:hypothetical protein
MTGVGPKGCSHQSQADMVFTMKYTEGEVLQVVNGCVELRLFGAVCVLTLWFDIAIDISSWEKCDSRLQLPWARSAIQQFPLGCSMI